MVYLKLMTFAGSTLFLGYLIWAKVCGSFVTQRMKYIALVSVMLVYVVPWAWLTEWYSRLFKVAAGSELTTGRERSVGFAEIEAGEEAYRTQNYWVLFLALGIWLCGVLLLMASKTAIYAKKRKLLLEVVVRHQNDMPEQVAKQLQEEFRYRRRVEVVEMPGENGTFTIGAIKPVIFLQKEYGEKDLEFIIRHEMVHITRRDLLAKLLLELVCCLHWFNPLVYLLKKCFDLVCETSCDERVVRGRSEEERKAYAKLLIDNVEEERPGPLLSSALGRDLKSTKERVNLIMKNKKELKNWKKAAAAGAFALMLGMNSLTALAYPDVYSVQELDTGAAEDSVSGETIWLYNKGEGRNLPTDVILYPEQFVDETGEIYPAYSSYGLVCTLFGHDIVSGYYQTHVKNDNGGCVIKTYDSTRCTTCNTIWVGDLLETTICEKCTH